MHKAAYPALMGSYNFQAVWQQFWNKHKENWFSAVLL